MNFLAQTNYYYQPVTTSYNGPSALEWAICVAVVVVYIVGLWKVFEKAGQAGWKSLIPIYNTIVELRIVGLSGWYVLLFIIPLVNLVLAIVVAYRLAKSFGFGIGMTILEFIGGLGVIIMGFGNSKYLGPNGEKNREVSSPQSN